MDMSLSSTPLVPVGYSESISSVNEDLSTDSKELQLREAMYGKRGTMKLKKRGERHVKKNKIRRDQRRHQPQQKSLRGKAAMPKTRARGKRTQKKRSFRPRMSYSKY